MKHFPHVLWRTKENKTLTSKDPGANVTFWHFIRVCTSWYWLVRYKQSSGTEMHHFIETMTIGAP